jgi:hypothetical protein
MIILDIYVPFLPPSNNKAFTTANIKGVYRQVLSEASRKFKRDFKDYVTRKYIDQLLDIELVAGKVLNLYITTYFTDIETKTPTAKYPYKRKDVLWGAKMVQDCVADITGIDDLYHFDLILKKRKSSTLPTGTPENGMEILLTMIDYCDMKGTSYGLGLDRT